MKWVILTISVTVAILLALVALTLEPPWQGFIMAFVLILVILGVANLFPTKP